MASVIDLLNSAINSNIVPNQEYILQGSVLDASVEVLLHRLRGLCDNVDSGPLNFNEHEMVFSIRNRTNPQPFTVRVRRSYDQGSDGAQSWMLRYIGNPELGDKSRPTVVRSCTDVNCSSNIVEFLTEMGFIKDYEYILQGYLFRKGRMKITVSKICRTGQGKAQDSLESISGSYFIELSVAAPSGQDAIGEDMKVFADQLRPLVQLEKIDPKRLQIL